MRSGAERLALAALALALAAFPGAATAQTVRPVYREIGDWLIACDNTRNCLARQANDPARAMADGEDEDVGIDIARNAGPNGVIEVRLRAEHRLDPAALHASGQAPLTRLPWRRSGDGQDATLSGEPARRFVRTIVDAPRLMLASKGASHLPLRGLAAVLLAMDEAQGRVGNASALMRPGSSPAGATPPPVQPPLVRVAPAAPPLANARALVAAVRRLHARTFAAHACDRDPGSDDAAYPITAADAIVVIGCGRFAYQTSVLVFRTPRDRPAAATLLRLPDPPVAPTDAESAGEYVGGSYDPATRTFSETAKGRGMADCGRATEWTFDGKAFHLSAFRWQDRCGGVAPGDWPILYRTRR